MVHVEATRAASGVEALENRPTRRLAPAVDPQRFVRIDRRDRSCRFSGPGPHRSSARGRELSFSSSRLRHDCNTAASRTALGCEHDSNVRCYGGPRALRRGRKRAAVRCPVASFPDDGDCCRRCCAVLRSLVALRRSLRACSTTLELHCCSDVTHSASRSWYTPPAKRPSRSGWRTNDAFLAPTTLAWEWNSSPEWAFPSGSSMSRRITTARTARGRR